MTDFIYWGVERDCHTLGVVVVKPFLKVEFGTRPFQNKTKTPQLTGAKKTPKSTMTQIIQQKYNQITIALN